MPVLEEKIFEKAVIEFDKLETYGFKQEKGRYVLEKFFMNGDFKAVVCIDNKGKVSGNVYDTASEDIYFPLRVEEMNGGFAGEVRRCYTDILEDIKNHCCLVNEFKNAQANRLVAALFSIYGDKPDFPWEDDNDYAVFRNAQTKKWYALIMNIDMSKVDKTKSGPIDVVNLKINEEKIPELVKKEGYYPAYHMNKKNWITVLLNDTLDDETVLALVDESYGFSDKNKKKTARK